MWVRIISEQRGHILNTVKDLGAGEAQQLIRHGIATPVPEPDLPTRGAQAGTKILDQPPRDKMLRRAPRDKGR